MEIKEYLAKNNITQAQMSREIGYHQLYMSPIVQKKTIPGKKLASAIEKYTKGECTVEELRRERKKDTGQADMFE